eukprot:TRINITY_DN422_c0_g2_i3.p1 TRINITY_DN422_c0_g2~~TRINITY_DN422_c0_g2_i3.p1  ORF type:complete len:569 (+),score=189.30 TRINITY_DN422_c0_g2_i3:107-1708(+)
MRGAVGLAALLAAGAHGGTPMPPKPHIFMVIVDDFGWAEVGYHRSDVGQVSTPTIDSLVKEGVELNRHYVHMSCTPTRASYQSGRLPVHMTTVLAGPCDINGAIARNVTGVAAKLKQAGYMTHHVGKWDAGMVTPHHTPQGRGYDTSLNYFGHANWMYSEIEWGFSRHNWTAYPDRAGLVDFWDTDKPAKDLAGTQYEEFLFRDRVISILRNHDQSKPLYLNYCSKVAHYPLQSPREYQEKFSFIENPNRRMYHSMVNVLDDNLKNMTDTMRELGMWDRTLMVLTGDNGGYVLAPEGGCNVTDFSGSDSDDVGHGTCCFNGEAGANNWPLRGGKYAPFEGGIRVNAFASGGFLPPAVRGTRLDSIIHVADWYGTFCALAGVDQTDHWAAASGIPPVDSVNVWPMLSGANATAPRTHFLVLKNLIVAGKWKYAQGEMIEANWGGPRYPNASTMDDPISNYTLQCPDSGCLFDLEADVTEHNEVSAQHPDVVAEMKQLLEQEAKTIWHVSHKKDPDCDALCRMRYGNYYGPFREV